MLFNMSVRSSNKTRKTIIGRGFKLTPGPAMDFFAHEYRNTRLPYRKKIG